MKQIMLIIFICFAGIICACDDSNTNNRSDGDTNPDADNISNPEISEKRFGVLYSYGQERPEVALKWNELYGMSIISHASAYVRELDTGWTREVSFFYSSSRNAGTLSVYAKKKLSAAKTDGLKVIATILADQAEFEANPNHYKNWLAATVRVYQNDIEYWQIHNEIGKTDRFENAADYLSFLKKSYDAIKSVSTNCKIMMASTIPEESYYSAVVDGGNPYVDAYDFHVFDESDFSGLQTLAALISKPLFVTELGTYSNHPSGYPIQTEAEQADTLIKWYVQAFHAGADYVFWASMIEFYKFHGQSDEFFDFFGLVYNGLCDSPPDDNCNDDSIDRGAGVKKEAFYALKTLISHIDRFVSVEKIQEGLYKFMVNGQPVYVVWCSGCVIEGLTHYRYNDQISFYK